MMKPAEEIETPSHTENRPEIQIMNENRRNKAYLSIGDHLKNERKKRNFSLKKISGQTKIGITILEKLEKNHLDQLPNKAYVKGFVKSYSKVLNLKVKDSLKVLDETYSYQSPDKKERKNIYHNELPFKITSRPILFLIFIPIVCLLSAIFFFNSYHNKLNQITNKQNNNLPIIPKSLSESTPLKHQPQKAIRGNTDSLPITPAVPIPSKQLPEQEEEAESHTAVTRAKKILEKQKEKVQQEILEAKLLAEKKEEALKIKKTEEAKRAERARQLIAKVNEQGRQEELAAQALLEKSSQINDNNREKLNSKPANLQTKKEAPVEAPIEFSNLSKHLYSIIENPSPEQMQHLPSRIKHAYFPGKQNIFINALNGDTWITYKQDEKKIKKFVLKQGRTLLIRADEARIFLGNVNVTKIYLNNAPLRIHAKRGVKSLVFPQENAHKYKLPLFIYNKKTGSVQTSSDYNNPL